MTNDKPMDQHLLFDGNGIMQIERYTKVLVWTRSSKALQQLQGCLLGLPISGHGCFTGKSFRKSVKIKKLFKNYVLNWSPHHCFLYYFVKLSASSLQPPKSL